MDINYGQIIADSFNKISKFLHDSTILEIRNIGELFGEVLLHVLPKGIYMIVGSVTKFMIVLLLAYLIAVGFFIVWEATLNNNQQGRLSSEKEKAKDKKATDAPEKADKTKEDDDSPRLVMELPSLSNNAAAAAGPARLSLERQSKASLRKSQTPDAAAAEGDQHEPAPQLSVEDIEKLLNEIKEVDGIEIPPAEINDENLNKIISDSESPRGSKRNTVN